MLAALALSATGCASQGVHLGQASIVTAATTFSKAPESSSEEEAKTEDTAADEAEGDSSGSSEAEPAAPKKPEFKGGTVNVNVTTASVTIDDENVIKSLKLDKYELAVEVDKDGYLIGDISTDGVKSAKEMQYDYGMKPASKIGLEWFEQVENFENWAVGKTVNELLAMKTVRIDDERVTVPGEPDLNVSVTINVGDFLKAVRAAAINAGWDPESDAVSSSEQSVQEVDYSSFFESSAETVPIESSSF